MHLDTGTIVFMILAICVLIAGLLLVAWWNSRAESILAWGGGCFAFISLGVMLYLARGRAPDFLTIDLANALLFLGVGFGWAGGRAFNGNRVYPIVVVAGAIAWLIACRIPEFYQSLPLRIFAGSLGLGAYIFAVAIEYWRGRSDELVYRRMLVAALLILAALFAIRVVAILFAQASADFPVAQASADFLAPNFWLTLTIIGPVLVSIVIVVLVVAMTKERSEAAQWYLAQIDPLTKAFNRGASLTRIEAIMESGRVSDRSAAMLLFDLDYFKKINDKFGHPAGDQVLIDFVAVTTEVLREGDVFGRIGGEEFLAFLPGVDEQSALAIAERIRTAFANNRPAHGRRHIRATVSIGVAIANNDLADLDTLLVEADKALYSAKANGRDQVFVALDRAA